jgi:hypothetical protein
MTETLEAPPQVEEDEADALLLLITAWLLLEAEVAYKLSSAAAFIERGREESAQRQLQGIARLTRSQLPGLLEQSRVFLTESMPNVYLGGTPLTPAHQPMIQALISDTYARVESASKGFSGNARRLAARKRMPTVKQLDRGVPAITYANGAQHQIGNYMSMLLRTKTAMASNYGTLFRGVEQGAQVVKISDGIDCGLVSHNDPDKADGLILPAGHALLYPISHPNCVRTLEPLRNVGLEAADRPPIDGADIGDLDIPSDRIGVLKSWFQARSASSVPAQRRRR